MAFKLSEVATDDLFHIYVEGVRLFGQKQAEAYYASLQDAFEYLGENPRVARERLECTPPVRVLPHDSHVIVYRLESFGVWIMRICHSRENRMAMSWNEET